VKEQSETNGIWELSGAYRRELFVSAKRLVRGDITVAQFLLSLRVSEAYTVAKIFSEFVLNFANDDDGDDKNGIILVLSPLAC
jgi:hypothetical protein